MQDVLYGLTFGCAAAAFSQESACAAIATGFVVHKGVSKITEPVEKATQVAYNAIASGLSTTGSYLSTSAYLLATGALYLKLAEPILPSNSIGSLVAKVAIAALPVLATKILVIDPAVKRTQGTIRSVANTISDGAKISVALGELVLTHKIVQAAHTYSNGNADQILIGGSAILALSYLGVKAAQTIRNFYQEKSVSSDVVKPITKNLFAEAG